MLNDLTKCRIWLRLAHDGVPRFVHGAWQLPAIPLTLRESARLSSSGSPARGAHRTHRVSSPIAPRRNKRRVTIELTHSCNAFPSK